MKHEQGAEDVNMWKAAQRRMSGHEWGKERLFLMERSTGYYNLSRVRRVSIWENMAHREQSPVV